MKMRPFGRLIPWTEALRRLEADVVPIARRETLPVAHAVGRSLARPYRAKVPVPPFDRATWDGYALRARDTRLSRSGSPARLRLVGEVYAEGGFRGPVGPGEAVAVATGGAIPPGADTVVPFEEVVVRGSSVFVRSRLTRGDRIAVAGEDLARGALLADAGQLLAPADLGALAITGTPSVEVWRKPVVTIVPNGNELRAPGTRLGPGAIYESNNATLAALVEASGGIARTAPPVRDDPKAIEAAVRAAIRQSDLVLVTGGSSVGERDYLPKVFARLGRVRFHGVAIRPGKPTLAVRVGRVVVVGMPGHPTSCLSNGFWLVLPVLRRLARLPGDAWTQADVRLAAPVLLPTSGFATVIPLRVRAGRATPTYRGSSAIASLGGANAYAIWQAGRAPPQRGEVIRARVLLPPLGPPGWGSLPG
jgi:molybdopterin molybdotransferase